jgi:hypothetical protein
MRAHIVFKVRPHRCISIAASCRGVGRSVATCFPPFLQADAGLTCPFCRNFVDGFTDINGWVPEPHLPRMRLARYPMRMLLPHLAAQQLSCRCLLDAHVGPTALPAWPPPCSRPNTIQELVEANRAAQKSAMARRTGATKAVSTSVPDPTRLLPPGARPAAPPQQPAAEVPPWTCPQCRHSNSGSRTDCSRCKGPSPAAARAAAFKDPLHASEEELLKAACERGHPGLNRAFQDAGMPYANVRLGCCCRC